MTKTKRSIIMSVLMLLLCVAAMAGATYALFSDSVEFDQHLQAGTLDITLKRTLLEKAELASTGFLIKNPDNNGKPDDRVIDFSNRQPENVFGIESGDKIVPGCWYEATFSIENHSDVAFGYWIEIVCTENDKKDAADLAKQLKITVNSDNEAFIGEGLVVKADGSAFIKVLARGETDTFTVKVEFLDSHIEDNKIDANNKAKNQKIDFDLVVNAMQVTDAPQQTENPPANP